MVNKKKNIGASAAGLAVGAAIGAAAVALSDKKNRAVMKKTAQSLTKQATDKLDEVKKISKDTMAKMRTQKKTKSLPSPKKIKVSVKKAQVKNSVPKPRTKQAGK